jgi:hypothetical protein
LTKRHLKEGGGVAERRVVEADIGWAAALRQILGE